jgi:hypothetical protein
MGYTRFSGLAALANRLIDFITVATYSTAGAITLTAADIIGGMILRDCNGGARADLVPTATAILAALEGKAVIGQAFRFTIRNTSSTAVSITVTTNTGITLSGTMTIAQNNSKDFLAVITAIGTPAVTIYSLGTVVF